MVTMLLSRSKSSPSSSSAPISGIGSQSPSAYCTVTPKSIVAQREYRHVNSSESSIVMMEREWFCEGDDESSLLLLTDWASSRKAISYLEGTAQISGWPDSREPCGHGSSRRPKIPCRRFILHLHDRITSTRGMPYTSMAHSMSRMGS